MISSEDAVGASNSSSSPKTPEHTRRPVNMLAGTVGHFVEWYDWYIYGLLAAVFSSQIFPSDSAFASLMAALLTYAIGFVVRPLSGIIISPLADRFGRRSVLTLCVSGMAVGSLIIALTPPLVIVAICLVVYTTLPETGNRGDRGTVAPADTEVLEGEHLLLSRSPANSEPTRSPQVFA